MSDEITEHVSYDRGYNKGFEEGRKRAFELVGELAEFYENGVGIDEDASDQEKKEHDRDCKLQTNACRYAQIVIRQNDFTDADLPW